MSHSFTSRRSRVGLRFVRRFARSRTRRFSLEVLETRQLLSVSGASLGQFVAHPNLTAAPLVYSPSPTGLSPNQVRQAYGINQLSFQNGSVAGTGAGQTIAIVTAYDDDRPAKSPSWVARST